MGVADRDYMRERPPRRSNLTLVLVLLVAAVGFVAFTDRGRGALRWARGDGSSNTNLQIGLGSGLTSAPRGSDPWSGFLAPESVCPNGDDSSASTVAQQQTAMCLLNYARGQRGLAALPEQPALTQWSTWKAADIVRCREFAHTPCGQAGDRYARAAGFTGAFGENIFLGPQIYKSPLAAVDGWLNSDRHRENLFSPRWRYQGIALLHTERLRGQRDVAVWVSEFSD